MTTTLTNPPDEKLLKVDRLGRVRTPRKEREALVDEFERSGLPGTKFAELHGLNYQTFATWVQKRRRKTGFYEKSDSRENAPQPKPKTATYPTPDLKFTEVILSPKADETDNSQGTPIRIELAGGAYLHINSSEQISLAVELLQALATSPPC